MYWLRILLILVPFISLSSQALEKALVLPKNVNYANLRTAQVSETSKKYDSQGVLKNQGDFYTQSIDLPKLMKFLKPERKAELQKLVDALNQTGRSDLGDKMSLGQLKIDIKSDVKYMAPIFARGLTDRFTLAIAVPVVQYSVDVRMSQVNSNIPQIKNETATLADSSGDLKAGLDRLDQDLTMAVQDVMAEKGYKKIQSSRKDTFLADVQVVGLYQFYKNSNWASVLKSVVVLPTGPRDDPDDLTDVTSQHQTAIGATIIQDYSFTARTGAGVNVGYHARLPDQMEKRVPMSEDDVLPDAERKENLERDLGDTVIAGVGVHHALSDEIEISAGWEWGHKQEDKYRGGREYNYDLLSKNTIQDWQRGMAGVEYSTVQGFMLKKYSVPYAVSYDFSDVVTGRNIERTQIHEVAFKMYF